MAFGAAGKTDADAPKVFQYEAVTPAGTRVRGAKARMTAYSPEAVRRELVDQGFVPIEIREVSGGGLNVDVTAFWKNRPLKLKPQALAAFSRQLHQLLRAGISVPRAVAALGEDAADARLTEMCNDMSTRVQAGVPLSTAFAEYPAAFDDVFCAYIQAGEETGALVATTERLARMMEKRAQLALKVKSVTAYPKMVAGVIGLLVTGILLFLVPSYAKIYNDFGAQLPAPTQALVNISHQFLPITARTVFKVLPVPWTIRPNLLSPVLWIGVAVLAVRWFLRATKDNPDVGIKVDTLRFRLPIFGQLSHKLALFRWSSTLAGALASGVQTYASLDLAARASGSRWIAAVTPALREALQTGRPLSAQLAEYPKLFPANLRTMVTTGEASGELSDMLGSVSNALDDEIDAIVSGLGAKIEVALLMVLGVVVGGLLVVLYLPILNLATTVGDGLEKQNNLNG